MPPLPIRAVITGSVKRSGVWCQFRVQERDGVGGEVLVMAAAHLGDDDVAVDQRVVKPRTTKPGTPRRSSAIFWRE